MKVLLTVVQGKPEGKVIPLGVPNFKIGRGESCHLRPNSEQVSREHAEIRIANGQVSVRDLNSRNGTFLNGKRVAQETVLNNADLVQVGPLTFSVSIQGAPVVAGPVQPAPSKTSDIDKVRDDEIESWLIADSSHQTPTSNSGVYGGSTIVFDAQKGMAALRAKVEEEAKTEIDHETINPQTLEDRETPTQMEAETISSDAGAEPESDPDSGSNSDSDSDSESEAPPEWVDESNPFHQKKKPGQETAAAVNTAKQSYKDSADAANDILRRMMERRRSQK